MIAKLRLTASVVAVILAATVAAGCSSGSTSSGTSTTGAQPSNGTAASSGALHKLTLALGVDTKSTPVFVGKAKGIYEKYGIDLNLLLLPTGVQQSTALQAGQAQFAAPAISNAPIAREQGIDEVAVAGIMNDPTTAKFDSPVAIVARQGSGIADVQGLRGKKIGVAVGGTADQYMRAVLASKGMSASDIQIVNISDPGSTLSAFRNGSVDALATWEPLVSQVMAAVSGSTVVSRGGNHLGYVMLGYASKGLISKQPELVQAFVTATADAAHYARGNPDEAAEIAAKELNIDASIVKEAQKNEKYDPRLSDQTAQAWQDSVSLLVKQGKMKEQTSKSSPEQSIDATFIKAAEKQHPEFFQDLPTLP